MEHTQEAQHSLEDCTMYDLGLITSQEHDDFTRDGKCGCSLREHRDEQCDCLPQYATRWTRLDAYLGAMSLGTQGPLFTHEALQEGRV
jgi:hypothetical protein